MKTKQKATTTKTLSKDQFKTVHLSLNGPFFTHKEKMIIKLLMSGLRLKEIEQLETKDVNFEEFSRNTIGRIKTKLARGNATKLVSSEICVELKELVEKETQSNYPFSDDNGRLTIMKSRKLLFKLQEVANIPSIHQLRRCYADLYLRSEHYSTLKNT